MRFLGGTVATTRGLDAPVPVREGEYGSKVTTIEPGGVEYIPERERHGSPLQLFWTWMSPNMEFATVFVGVLPIALFGGGFWPTVFGVVLGSLLGSVTHGILSAMGPRFGVPQMVGEPRRLRLLRQLPSGGAELAHRELRLVHRQPPSAAPSPSSP